jgi:3-hydroxybutyryl-CoA dehydrogenase
MNPAPFIPGVELIPGPQTSPAVLDLAEELIRSLGKTPARVADTPGFVANRLQFALYKEATRIVEEGVAAPSQIDAVVSSTFGFRLALFGPFAIGDMAGLDVYESSYRTLEKAYGDRFSPPEALTSTVEDGNLGLKTGRGFLDIDAASREDLVAYRDSAYARLSQLRAELGQAPGL